jgi:hypothetical protein
MFYIFFFSIFEPKSEVKDTEQNIRNIKLQFSKNKIWEKNLDLKNSYLNSARNMDQLLFNRFKYKVIV